MPSRCPLAPEHQAGEPVPPRPVHADRRPLERWGPVPDRARSRAAEPAWSTRSGFVLATIASAIGIGSIWKFPYEVGTNGGGAFVVVYVVGLALVVVPLMLAEFAIGRRG